MFEVSTFRREPSLHAGDMHDPKSECRPENMILSDNSYGSSVEDAFRRDFTVNALFYNPVKKELIDHTGQGIADIRSKTVRAIGVPALRFEEDPVRMLRALKLVAQFDFSLEPATENALFASLDFFRHAAPGRLSLELEKILKSVYSDRHIEIFFDYGLLNLFLPNLAEAWGSEPLNYALNMLNERNCRVEAGLYRDSISLALAAAALPFAEAALGAAPGELWKKRSDEVIEAVRNAVENLFAPQTLMIKMREAAIRVILMQSQLENFTGKSKVELFRQRSYAHARELLLIRHLALGEDISEYAAMWPQGEDTVEKTEFFPKRKVSAKGGKKSAPGSNRRRNRRNGKRPETPPDFSVE
jgi:poly(A) polymerase